MSNRCVVGDSFNIRFPADIDGLRAGGVSLLDSLFHRFGALDRDNHVVAVTEFEECPGGSTGRKLLLSVRYTREQLGLPEKLFVKFSRDFDNPRRDRGRTQMDREVRFAILSRANAFPIPVPHCVFADYHRASGTGLLITERIPYGRDPVEPHYDKCLDYRMPAPLEHYSALLSSVAALAGAQRAGRLSRAFDTEFGYDPAVVTVGQRKMHSPSALLDLVARYRDFAERYPTLLPEPIREPRFLARMADEAVGLANAHDDVLADLQATRAHVALCHWNANVDNAWFWRDSDGVLRCGLLDWGCVSEMNLAMPLWGALCSAETDTWDGLDQLLADFVTNFEAAGGGPLDVGLLRRQLISYALVMGVAWLLDAPAYITAVVPELPTVADRKDPRIADNEVARTQLLMLTNFLSLWAGR